MEVAMTRPIVSVIEKQARVTPGRHLAGRVGGVVKCATLKPDNRRMKLRTFACLSAMVCLAACDGVILPGDEAIPPIVKPPTKVPPVVIVDAGPPPCEPAVQAVPKLLRLSNFEYRSMVADVLGVPVNEALFTNWTPVAQVYGFDTMSETRLDAQALDVQLATAEKLSTLVMSTPALTAHCPAVAAEQTPVCTLKPTYSALDDFSDSQGRDCWNYLDSAGVPMVFDNTNSRWRKEPDQTVFLWALGTHPGTTLDSVRRWKSPVDGAVKVTGRFADADAGGGDGVLVSIRKNGVAVFTQDIANGGAPALFDVTLQLLRNDQLDFVVNRKTTPSNDTTAFSASIGFTPTARKSAWTWANCVEPLVARLTSRSFRRPVRAEELADYKALFETALQGATAAGFTEPMNEALPAALQAVFLSPNFVFKPELVPGGLDKAEQPFGVAARLGLYFRSSIADEELWMLAGVGALQTTDQIRTQAVRLLEQDVDRFSVNFGGQWLDYREAITLSTLTPAMQRESRDLFTAVMNEGLTPERLLKPGFTVVDAPLATFYGLPMGNLAMPGRITTDQRGGLLQHGLFLARTGSGSEFRRPIHRGLWVLTRLLCRSLPHLDAATLEEIAASFGSINPTLPLPEQMAIHRNTTTRCGGCHSLMDPIGLGLEKYDAQGKWRETYASGAPINTSLELDGVIIRNPTELTDALVGSNDYRSCVAAKLFTFGLNRGPTAAESCTVQRIGRPLDGSKPTLKTMTIDALMKSIAQTEVKP